MKPYLLAALLALAAAPSPAAVVRLKDGRSLTGTVVGATARDVRVLTEEGSVLVETDRISSIDYAAGEAPAAAAGGLARSAPAAAPVHEPERHSLSLEIGITGPVSDVGFENIGGGRGSNGGVGPAFGGRYLYETTPRLGLGLDLQWLGRSATRSFGLLSNAQSNVAGGSVLMLGVVKYDLRGRGDARPFVALGAGGHRTTLRIDAQPNEGFVWADSQTSEVRRLVEGAAWGFAGSARLGVELRLWDPMTFSVEAGWTALSGASYAPTSAGRAIGLSDVTGPVQLIVVAGRWGWRF